MASPQNNTYSALTNRDIVAGYYSTPSWAPAAGQFVNVSYATHSHPQGLPAVLEEISPQYQSWNPRGVGTGPVGPWGGAAPAILYNFYQITDYCGMTFSPSLRKYIGFGAGHASICVTAPYAFDLATRSWEWMSVPIPSDGFTKLNGQPATASTVATYYPPAQFDTTWGDWNGSYSGWPEGFAQPGKIFPETGHSYTSLLTIPGPKYGNENGALLVVSSPTGATTGTDMIGSHLYDFDSRSFLRTTNRPISTGNTAGGLSYDPTTNKVYMCTWTSSAPRNTMDVLDVATKTWSTRTSTNYVELMQDSGGMVTYPDANIVMLFTQATPAGVPSFSGTTHLIRAASISAINNNNFTWSTIAVSGSSWPLRGDGTLSSIAWAYCPLDKCLYAVNGRNNSTSIWKISPPPSAMSTSDYLTGTWTISQVTMTSGALYCYNRIGSPTVSSYVYNRLQWDNESSSFLWSSDYYGGPVQAFRPPGV